MKSLAVKPKAFFPDFGSVSPSDPEHFLYGEKKEFEIRFLPGTVKAGDLLILAVDNDFNFYDPDPSNLTHCAPVMCLGRHEVTAEEAAEQKADVLLETQTADFRDKTNGCARPLAAKMGLYKWSDESYSLLAIGSAYCHPVLATYDIPLSPIVDDSYYTKEQIDGMVDAKLDKPAVEGTAGQILGLGQDGSTVWKDEPSFEQVQADWDESDSTEASYIQNKPDLSIYAERSELSTVASTGSYNDLSNTPDLSVYAEKSELAPVATSGDYADLSNKPAIPTKVSDLTNDSNFQTAQDVATTLQSYVPETRTVNGHALSQDVTVTASDLGLATVATTGSYNDLSNKPVIPTDTSELTNGAGFVTAADLAPVATTGSYNDLSDQPTLPTADQLVPAATSSDAGKVLTVGATGTPAWEEAASGGDPLDYLCFTAGQANSTVNFKKDGNPDAIDVEYSTDNKETWNDYTWATNDGLTITLNSGDSVYFRAKSANAHVGKGWSDYHFFRFGGIIYASGNVMSLLDKTCKLNEVTDNFCFVYLFSGFNQPANNLYSAPELPAKKLAGQRCYARMFYRCTHLTAMPELPATILSEGCYDGLFGECTSLNVVKSIPIATLAPDCFSDMFSRCTSLRRTPELPALELANSCYKRMFAGCTGLESAGELPATTLAESCYAYMFSGCTSLKKAPKIYATTFIQSCFHQMFYDCRSLVDGDFGVPVDVGVARVLYETFMGCSSLAVAPKFTGNAVGTHAFIRAFSGCTSMHYLKASWTSWNQQYPSSDWFENASTTGVFDCPSTLDTTAYVPSGWTVCHNDYDASLEPESFEIPAASTAQLLLPPTAFSHAPSAATVYTLWHDPDKAVETVRIVVDMTATNAVSFQDENGVAIPSGTWSVGSEVEFTCTYANGGWAVVGDDGSKGASQADVQSMIADALTMH